MVLEYLYTYLPNLTDVVGGFTFKLLLIKYWVHREIFKRLL